MSQNTARDYPEDSQHENGNYFCVCLTCHQQFIGYKRRVTCKLCADGHTAEDEPIITGIRHLGAQDNSVVR